MNLSFKARADCLRIAFILQACFLFLISETYSQKGYGYYITRTGDSIFCQIKIPKEMRLGLKEVMITDSVGNEATFTPYDIKSFGYHYKNESHIFAAKHTLDSTVLFIELLTKGKNTNVFYYDIKDIVLNMSSPGNPSLNTPGIGRRVQTYQQLYLFEIRGRGNFFLSTNSVPHANDLESIKSKLKYFYGSNIEIMKLISERFKNRSKIMQDIKALAEAVNQM